MTKRQMFMTLFSVMLIMIGNAIAFSLFDSMGRTCSKLPSEQNTLISEHVSVVFSGISTIETPRPKITGKDKVFQKIHGHGSLYKLQR